jgi:nickel/cobalt transporter (NiCoT) family protein
MERAQWRPAAALATVIVALHVIGFAALAAGAVGVGLGLTAYTLGLRHAFDADHIAAIDGTTRKLMGEGQRPLSVGFFFSLGHSTVVFALALLFAVGIRAFAGDGSTLDAVGAVVGPSVSGGFLLIIGVLNLGVLASIVLAVRDGEEAPAPRGVLARVYGRATRAVRKPWHMYPLGILFGLGFDTASEVALLFLAAGAVSAGLPFYAILALPVLFAAGMSLLDTIDGSFMNFAYGWALARPARKAFYNLVLTALSAGVALLVGGLELLGLVWERAAEVDLNAIGFAVVGLFALTFAAAWATWRIGHLEERWSRATTS